MPTYASLGEVKWQMAATASSSVTNDDIVLALLRAATAYVDSQFQARIPYFFPYVKTIPYRVNGYYIKSLDNLLSFSENLLALNSLTVGGQSVTAVEVWPAYTSPIHDLRLTNYSDSWYSYCTSDGSPAFALVNGVWGMHRDYANAWLQVDTLAGSFIANNTATTFTVGNVDDYDANYRLPRISAGHLIKVESEYMEVTHTDIVTNTVTVKRGVHGTTAAAHNSALPVYVWQVEDTIRNEVARQVGYMYSRMGAYESATIDALGVTSFPAVAVAALQAAIGGYAYGY